MVAIFWEFYLRWFVWNSRAIFIYITNSWLAWVIRVIRVNYLSNHWVITRFNWNIWDAYLTTIIKIFFSDLFLTYFISILISNDYFITWFYTTICWNCNIYSCLTMIIVTIGVFIIRDFTIMVAIFWEFYLRWFVWFTSKLWV